MSPAWTGFGDTGISAPDADFDPPPPARFASGGKIAGLTNGENRMDLFAVASDHRLYTCTWTVEHEWSGVGHDKHWQSLGYGENPDMERVFDAATSDIVAVRRRVWSYYGLGIRRFDGRTFAYCSICSCARCVCWHEHCYRMTSPTQSGDKTPEP